jgi:hypothetical protein
MAKNARFVGLDVHAETIAVAVAEGRGKVEALGTAPRRCGLLGKVGKPGELRIEPPRQPSPAQRTAVKLQEPSEARFLSASTLS